ncbi:ABC transporter substrate-binding protein [Paenibacillus baekrokdamisoli]|uniref:ABC transporter substrate-binding protein n=1 Tax=Paenibacillus baekrokdamisoli TaxID=1712516 RepID=A0A3G9JIB4_9BACL|nr:ABC transporter substrate-binding protein [Paenibacillus baekrokdamisoli]MBB3068233.1 putative aldouronate transport system substrate-binding protein [Paenibacillus baekrokdamisoli]BBH22724.1 ABC transporter substrate-binding protein [Paenibacillus baekrokdamisoli]
MKKKNLSLALVAMLMLSTSLSACGSKNNDVTQGTNDKPKDEAKVNDTKKDDTENEKTVELMWYSIGAPQKDTDLVMEELSKYTKEKINATIKMKQIDWGDYTQKMQVISASGDPWDLAFTCSWAFDYVQNVRKGVFAELDQLIEEYGQGTKKALNPAFLEGSKVNGHNYAIPVNKELPAQPVWRFNKNLVDKYKLDISSIKTLADLEPLLKVVKEKEGYAPISADKNFGLAFPYDYIIEGLPLGVKLGSTDNKIVNMLEDPEVVSDLQTLHKYYKAGYLPKDVATLQSGDAAQTGKWLVDKADTQPLADILWSESLGYPIVSKPIREPIVFNWSVTGSMIGINAQADDLHKKKAMQFLELLNTDPYVRNMVDSGIEGVHYKKLSENVKEDLPAAKERYDMPSFSLGNIMLTYLSASDPANKWEEFEKFNSAATNAPTLGFKFDTTPVASQIGNLNNVKEEFYPSIMTGTVDPSEFIPKAIKKFKDAGLDDVLAEAQKQFDEWRSANGK